MEIDALCKVGDNMDPQIIAAIIGGIIGAVGAIIAALIAILPVIIRKEKQKIESQQVRAIRNTLRMLDYVPPATADVFFETDEIHVNINEDFSSSQVRTIKYVAREGSKPLYGARLTLATEGINDYLSKIGKKLSEVDPDKEFGIIVKDKENDTILTRASTDITGEKNENFVTYVPFDNPLVYGNPIELEIKYSRLDKSFYLKQLWETHTEEWSLQNERFTMKFKLQIFFPERLPRWFRMTALGINTVPAGWARIHEEVRARRRVLIAEGSNLQPDITYEIVINAS